MAITDTQIDNAIPEYGDTTPHPTQPNQALMNQLLKGVRDEVATALTAGSLQQNVGNSTTTAMSQKAVSDQLLGVGQTWQNVTSSRTVGTNYTNTTGRTIAITVRSGGGGSQGLDINVNGITVFRYGNTNVSSQGAVSAIAIIPPNYVYSATSASGISSWMELR